VQVALLTEGRRKNSCFGAIAITHLAANFGCLLSAKTGWYTKNDGS